MIIIITVGVVTKNSVFVGVFFRHSLLLFVSRFQLIHLRQFMDNIFNLLIYIVKIF